MPPVAYSKILLTGGTGFLGSNLLRMLLKSGLSVVVLKRSFSNPSRIQDCLHAVKTYDIDQAPLSRVFEENKIDVIINCATDYGRKRVEPMRLVEANLIMPLTLLQLAEKHEVKVFVNTDTILDKRVSHYSLSKRQFLDWLKAYSDRLICINMALEHFFGPDDDATKFVTSVIFNLLSDAEKMDLTLGEQKRDFIYIEDVTDAFLKVLKHSECLGRGFYKFEVGAGMPKTIREVVSVAKEIARNKKMHLNFGALPYRENEVMTSNLDLDPLLKLGWQPRFTLEEGLSKTIDFERKRLGK